MIEISNDGAEIRHTNYWETPHAKEGFVFGSWNAGALRLLLPEPVAGFLPDMRTAQTVVVTRGRCAGSDGECLEVLFEDHSERPYVLLLDIRQCDRPLPAEDHGKEIAVSVWTPQGKQAQWSGVYRVSDSPLCDEAP